MSDDLIRRIDAIEALGEEPLVWNGDDYEVAERNQWRADKAAIEAVPSATKTGRWVHDSRGWVTPGGDPVWVCSECGKGKHVWGVEWNSYGIDVADHQWVACPNCGSVMRGEKNE